MNLLKLLLTLIIALLININATTIESNNYRATIGKKQSWIKDYKIPPTATIKDPVPVFYNYYGKQVNFIDKKVLYHRRSLTALTSDGLKEVAKVEIPYCPDFQELVIHSIVKIREGDTLNALDTTGIEFLRKEELLHDNMLNGVITATLVLKDIRIKDIVDIQYSIIGGNPVFGDKYFSGFQINYSVYLGKSVYRCVVPEKRELNFKGLNHEFEPLITVKDNKREYLWLVNNPEKKVFESGIPPWFNPFQQIFVSEYDSWGEVVEWALPLYPEDAPLGDELNVMLLQWKKIKDPKKRAKAVLDYVQRQIRYFGIEIGMNSHKPRLPIEVMEKRFGDCKDKALLLSILLKKLDIEAWPALVSYRNNREVSKRLPSPGAFDHVITYVNIEDDIYWLDGTRSIQLGSLAKIGFTSFGKALVLKKKEKKLLNVCTPDEYENGISNEDMYMSEHIDSGAYLTITTQYSGYEADMLNYTLTQVPIEKIGENFFDYYKKLYPSAELIDSMIMSIDSLNNFVTLKTKYHIKDFFNTANGICAFDFNNGKLIPYVKIEHDVANRKYPYYQSYPFEIKNVSTITLPFIPELDVEDLDTSVISDKYHSYKTWSKLSGSTYSWHSKYYTKNEMVEAYDFPEHIKTSAEIEKESSWGVRVPYINKQQVETKTEALLEKIASMTNIDSTFEMPKIHEIKGADTLAFLDMVAASLEKGNIDYISSKLCYDSAGLYILDDLYRLSIKSKVKISAFASSNNESIIKNTLKSFLNTYPLGCKVKLKGFHENYGVKAVILEFKDKNGNVYFMDLKFKHYDNKFEITNFYFYDYACWFSELTKNRYSFYLKEIFKGGKIFSSEEIKDPALKLIKLMDEQKYGSAFELLPKLSDKDKLDPYIVFLNKIASRSMGMEAERNYYNWLNETFSIDSRYCMDLALFFRNERNLDLTQDAISNAFNFVGGDPNYLSYGIAVSLDQGNIKSALAHYFQLLKHFPENVESYFNMLELLVDDKKYKVAVQVVDLIASRFSLRLDRNYCNQKDSLRKFINSNLYKNWEDKNPL